MGIPRYAKHHLVTKTHEFHGWRAKRNGLSRKEDGIETKVSGRRGDAIGPTRSPLIATSGHTEDLACNIEERLSR